MYDFFGIHIIGELYGVEYNKLNSIDILEKVVNLGIIEAKATSCGTIVKKFYPTGVTLMVLLSESHISIHTYPEFGSMFFDIFTCGNKCMPQKVVEILKRELHPLNQKIKILERGA